MTNSDENQSEKIRFLLVDDHPLVRESLKRLIQREPDWEVSGEAENRERTLTLLAACQPRMVILDLSLADAHGTELIGDLHHQYPDLLILVLSMHDELVYSERVIRAGAHGYINKNEAPAKILQAIRRVLSGEIYWTERAAARVASKIARPSRTSKNGTTDCLTERELQVLELIGTGQSTRQIGALLHIDVSTVETYRARIKDKLTLKDAAELLQFAIRWSKDVNDN